MHAYIHTYHIHAHTHDTDAGGGRNQQVRSGLRQICHGARRLLVSRPSGACAC